MAVLTKSQINDIWANKTAITEYVYVCEDGCLYKGLSNGALFKVLNTNYDTWNKQKKLNENDSLQASNTQNVSEQNNTNQVSVTTQSTGEESELTYDSSGNLTKKTLSLNGKIIETKTFSYDEDGGLTKLVKSDINGMETKNFNFNENGDLTSINIT